MTVSITYQILLLGIHGLSRQVVSLSSVLSKQHSQLNCLVAIERHYKDSQRDVSSFTLYSMAVFVWNTFEGISNFLLCGLLAKCV